MRLNRIVMFGAVAACSAALAQTASEPPPPRNNAIAYKCVNADGSVVFSQDPCSTDPKKMQTIDTSSALRTGSGGHQNEIAASVADSDCRDNAYKANHGTTARIEESNRHIAEYRQRRQALESQAAYYGSADPETAKAMNDLDAAVAQESEFQQKEMAFSEQNYQTALRACDNARNSAPAPSAAPPAPPNPAPKADDGG